MLAVTILLTMWFMASCTCPCLPTTFLTLDPVMTVALAILLAALAWSAADVANFRLIEKMRREAANDRTTNLGIIAQLRQAAADDAQRISTQNTLAFSRTIEMASLRSEIASLRGLELQAPTLIRIEPYVDASEGHDAPDSMPVMEDEA